MLTLSLPSFAHHSFSAEFNINAPVTLKGELTSVDWINPHAYVTLAVRENGALEEWRIEGASPSSLTHSGWTPDMLWAMVQSHNTVTVTGYLALRMTGSKGVNLAKRIRVTGVVTNVDWRNPACIVSMDARDSTTQDVIHDTFELGTPGALAHAGWLPDTLKTGMTITVSAMTAPDGSNRGTAFAVKLPDGRTMNGAGNLTSAPPQNEAWAKTIEFPDGRNLKFN
jgi:hypothetical protein